MSRPWRQIPMLDCLYRINLQLQTVRPETQIHRPFNSQGYTRPLVRINLSSVGQIDSVYQVKMWHAILRPETHLNLLEARQISKDITSARHQPFHFYFGYKSACTKTAPCPMILPSSPLVMHRYQSSIHHSSSCLRSLTLRDWWSGTLTMLLRRIDSCIVRQLRNWSKSSTRRKAICGVEMMHRRIRRCC
jgi:hypothetical protein